MGIQHKITTFLILTLFFIPFNIGVAWAQETPQPEAGQPLAETPTPTSVSDTSQEQKDLQSKISEYEGKIRDLQGEARTLSSQISVMDNQIYLTQLRITATKDQIANITKDIDTATKKIDNLQKSLERLTKVLMNRIVTTYEVGTEQPFHVLLSSDNATDFFTRLSYLKIVQENDKKLIFATEQAKKDYATQKTIFEDEKKKIEALQAQLVAYTKQLDIEKQSRKRLLAETQGSEANYQKLLAQARAEFTAIQGIISGGGSETEAGSVTEGQVIASVIPSTSCNSSGGHLHFIVSRNGATENPFNYLKGIDYKNCSGSDCGSGDGDSFNPSGSWNWSLNPQIEMTQGYGSTWATRNTWVSQIYKFHNGIDISGSSNEVKAVQAGILYKGSYAGYNCRLPYVRVRHTDGLDTFYLHVYY